jgi:hypothetical protein
VALDAARLPLGQWREIRSFRAAAHGSLEQVGTVGGNPAALAGLAAR